MRTYVGARYVPLIDGEWNIEKNYEPLTIVTYEGNSYTSRKNVPSGIDIKNTDYWANTGNYNAQIEEYRKDVNEISKKLDSKAGVYTNISALRKSTNLKNGMIVSTLGYYSQGDGGNNTFYIRNKIENDIDNGGSIIIVGDYTLISLSEKANILQFGARGDGVSDDYEVIQKCFNSSKFVYIPDKTFYVSKGLIFKGVELICDGILSSNNAITIITLGDADNLIKSMKASARTKGNNTIGQIGVLITNLSNSSIFSESTETETGVKIQGTGQGVINNEFSFGKILNCLYGIDIDADNTGWVNQNIFSNANIQNLSNDDRAFIKLKMENTKHTINGNTFIGFNLEGMNNKSKAIKGKCSYNIFINTRLEGATINCVELTNDSHYNNFISPIIFPLDTNVFQMPNTNYVLSQQYVYGSTYGYNFKSNNDGDYAFSTRDKNSNFSFASLLSYIRTNGNAMFNSLLLNGNLAFPSGFIIGRDSNPEGSQMGYAGCLCICTDTSDYGLYIKTTGTPESLSNTGWNKLNN